MDVSKEKLRFDLLPAVAIEYTVRAFMSGLDKYPAWDWLSEKHDNDLFYNALMRHLHEWRRGETRDAVSDLPPLAHVAANALILLTRHVSLPNKGEKR